DAGSERIHDAARSLLQHVRELVANQPLTLRRVRVVLPSREVDVGSMGEGESANRIGVRSDVNTNVGQVSFQDRFHSSPHRFWKPMAAVGSEAGTVARQLKGAGMRSRRRRGRLVS